MCAERAFVSDAVQYRVVSPSCPIVRFAKCVLQLGLRVNKKIIRKKLLDRWSRNVYAGGYAARRIMIRQTPDHGIIMLIVYLLLVLCAGRLIDAEKGKHVLGVTF